ncbi:hypothetical protein C2845_PM02G28290 [Panicum miliaceum]|uniref:Lon N-terminal domain-containing protein n=1 Tax=Panicum miliaceum TaxID=4540 RepID=A0A3L6S3U3_PANMI|nr:hypothetical protein C2845_PM02G28290 [Panicum miliaceum]
MLRAAATVGFPARLAAKRPLARLPRRGLWWWVPRALRCGPVPVPRRKACFCSNADAGSGPEAVEGAEATGGEEGEGENASSAIVPAAFRPEDCHTITRIQGDLVVLLGHHRVRKTEMVAEDPLIVKVDHLKEMPYDKDDDVIKATSFEVISTLRDVLKTNSLWKDQVQTYTQHMGDFNYPRLADLVLLLQVCKRLKLTLELVKRELEISKLQELGLETDDKTALSGLFLKIYHFFVVRTQNRFALFSLAEKFRERIEAKKDKCPPHVLQSLKRSSLSFSY